MKVIDGPGQLRRRPKVVILDSDGGTIVSFED